MIKLGVNIDHIATLRQARFSTYPDVLKAAQLISEKTQASGITIHLREDRRHIQDRDVYEIKKGIDKPLNLEMSLSDEIIGIAIDVKPHSCCIVPEKRKELTTEGGLDAVLFFERLKSAVARLHSAGILVSLFIEPDEKQVTAAAALGADFIEIHTGKYSNTPEPQLVEEITNAAGIAEKLGLGVNAGHGLNYFNVKPLLDETLFEEFNIGHSIIAESVFVGLREAVNEMLRLMGYNV